jgi:hypothetical protein
MEDREAHVVTGWGSVLAKVSLAALLFEGVTGLAITFAPFHPAIEWAVIVHTVVGVVTLLPIGWYYAVHWLDYRRYTLSHIVLLGYVGVAGLLVCSLSGLVVTWQGLFGIRMSGVWRNLHLISTFVALGAALPHILLVFVQVRRGAGDSLAPRFLLQTVGATVAGLCLVVLLTVLYAGPHYVNEFPEDYNYPYGEKRPFAPSLAQTTTGGAFDARSLAGSKTCGSAGCHAEILQEWQVSAHRYSAMDALFQKVQAVMAKQNGPESTRYCGGCHDPISLFSGTKNIFVEDLTNLQGYNEGVSCLACHSIRKTDLRGNANYIISQPTDYLWQWSQDGMGKVVRDFLIRTYPDQHNRLSKRMFKAPEYCAACHKQFIDKEVNQVGWVQLQNQYDNWKTSHWNEEGNPEKTIECRECHMPLVDSKDPGAGDASDYNRSRRDRKHRSHRFLASNNMMPKFLKLEGWEEQVRLTEQWLQGRYKIPEIQDKWREGPVVSVKLEVPETAAAGETIPIRVVMSSNKVGHDYPTGPLDIIQSWVELHVTDGTGKDIFASGRRNDKHFIEPGSFLFKAEPVDQYGNLIDRHNLWEMVGVRYRRSLFPGYSDMVEYPVPIPSTLASMPPKVVKADNPGVKTFNVPPVETWGQYRVTASLNYRKVDQYLLNFLLGEDSGVPAPIVEIARATATIKVKQ